MDNLVVVMLFTDPIPHMKIQCQCIVCFIIHMVNISLICVTIYKSLYAHSSHFASNSTKVYRLKISGQIRGSTTQRVEVTLHVLHKK